MWHIQAKQKHVHKCKKISSSYQNNLIKGGGGRDWESVRERQIEKAKERERERDWAPAARSTPTHRCQEEIDTKRKKKRENRAEEIRLRSTKKLFLDLSVCVRTSVCVWFIEHTNTPVCMLVYLRLYTGHSNSTQDNIQQCFWRLKEIFQDQKLSSTFVAWCWLPQKNYFDLSVDLDILLKQCIF